MILADGDWIGLKDHPPSLLSAVETLSPFSSNPKEALRQFEKQHILRVLQQAGQDRKEAARLLDIGLSSLYRKLEELGIS